MQGVILDTIVPLLLLSVALYLGVRSAATKPGSKLVFGIVITMLAIVGIAVLEIIFSPSKLYGITIALMSLLATYYVYLTLAKNTKEQTVEEDRPLTNDMESMRNKIALFSIFNNLQDIVLVINANEMVVFMNQQAVNLLGDQVGLSCNVIMGCGTEKCKICPVRQDRSEDVENEALELTIKGRKFDVKFSKIYNDPDGLLIMIARDITSRKMVERQLLVNEKMLSLGQLVAGVAHEINNPITFIMTNLEILEMMIKSIQRPMFELEEFVDAYEQNENGKDEINWIDKFKEIEQEYNVKDNLSQFPLILGDLKEGTDRVKKIVKDLKDFSHLGSLKAEKTDINNVIDLTLRVANNEIKNRVKVITELSGDIPEILAFPQQLKQVFLNLFVNAAHAIDNPDTGELRIKTEFVNDKVQIEVSDNGKGIESKYLRRIFEPFFTTKDVGEGTGLGLAVVYGIIERHGGEIEVKSKVKEGTTFYITLLKEIPEQVEEKDKSVSIYSV